MKFLLCFFMASAIFLVSSATNVDCETIVKKLQKCLAEKGFAECEDIETEVLNTCFHVNNIKKTLPTGKLNPVTGNGLPGINRPGLPGINRPGLSGISRPGLSGVRSGSGFGAGVGCKTVAEKLGKCLAEKGYAGCKDIETEAMNTCLHANNMKRTLPTGKVNPVTDTGLPGINGPNLPGLNHLGVPSVSSGSGFNTGVGTGVSCETVVIKLGKCLAEKGIAGCKDVENEALTICSQELEGYMG